MRRLIGMVVASLVLAVGFASDARADYAADVLFLNSLPGTISVHGQGAPGVSGFGVNAGDVARRYDYGGSFTLGFNVSEVAGQTYSYVYIPAMDETARFPLQGPWTDATLWPNGPGWDDVSYFSEGVAESAAATGWNASPVIPEPMGAVPMLFSGASFFLLSRRRLSASF